MLASVVVDNFNLHGAAVGPNEADSPLVVDADAVLAGAIAAERFEAMRGRHSEIAERGGCDHALQSHSGAALDVWR